MISTADRNKRNSWDDGAAELCFLLFLGRFGKVLDGILRSRDYDLWDWISEEEEMVT